MKNTTRRQSGKRESYTSSQPNTIRHAHGVLSFKAIQARRETIRPYRPAGSLIRNPAPSHMGGRSGRQNPIFWGGERRRQQAAPSCRGVSIPSTRVSADRLPPMVEPGRIPSAVLPLPLSPPTLSHYSLDDPPIPASWGLRAGIGTKPQAEERPPAHSRYVQPTRPLPTAARPL